MLEPLPASSLRWRCDPEQFEFETTADVTPVTGIIGQESALESLRFGIESDAPGQNVFVRGLIGTGRMTTVRRLLDEMMPRCTLKSDRCYVHNFKQPDRPRLLTLPPGGGRLFKKRVRELAEYIRYELDDALDSEATRARRAALERETRDAVEHITRPFQERLTSARLAMVHRQEGPILRMALFPLVDGKAVPPEELAKLRSEGKVTDDEISAWRESREAFSDELAEISRQVQRRRADGARAIAAVVEDTAREILEGLAREIREDFPGPDVAAFLADLIDDVAERLGHDTEENPSRLYDVNVLLEQEHDDACPIVIENTPTLCNLLGSVDREWGNSGPMPSDYRQIHAGSILRADGGYLILDARDVIDEHGAWRALLRTLRTGRLEIVPQELFAPWAQPTMKPEPIPVKLRVILLGSWGTYSMLDETDADFRQLFKVLADFDSEIPRTREGLLQYASVLARIAEEDELLPFDRGAVAALAEHGARIAARKDRLTARFSRIADIAREAAFLAERAGAAAVTAEDVHETVRRTKRRADLPSRRFQSLIADGTVFVQTEGLTVAQINGLAVMRAGMLTYGFPARITATIGPGNAGVIDIEASASLSGHIHTKGFQILGGLLRHLLATDHPLAFSASVAFEQSYGGIDGDSASVAEICCLLSALTDIPIRQSLAITGAIDQHGRVQAIGGLNEKIEGYYDACESGGLTGDQGVIIPRANAGELMLRDDVVAACEAGRFHVYAVERVHEALELLTGVPAGELDEEGRYPEDTLLQVAQQRAFEFWQRSLSSPTALAKEKAEREHEAQAAAEGV